MRIISRVLLSLFALAVIAGGIVYFNLNRIIKNEVESQGTSSLRLNTGLGSARLALSGGKLGLHDLSIASPKGYSAPHMLELGDLDVAVEYKELRGQPIHVASLNLKKPKLIIEQSNGVFNFKKASELQPVKPPSKDPMLLVIDEVKVDGAEVVLRPGIPGIPQEIVIPIPALVMKNVGSGKGAKNGAALKDVAMTIVSALAAKASESDALPPEVKALLHLNSGQLAAALGAEAQKQIVQALPKDVGDQVSKVANSPDVQKQLQGLFGGQQKPAGRAPAHR